MPKLQWLQPATDAAQALSFTYKAYVDGSPTGIALTGVTAAQGPVGQQTMSANVPSGLSVGPHPIQMTASTVAGESQKSFPPVTVMIQMPVFPAMPSGVVAVG